MSRPLTAAELDELADLATTLREWSPGIFPHRFSGRGIVVAAGGSAVFTNAYILIHMLRNALGCQLPIEVWHFGPAEMSPAMAALLDDLDVAVVDAEPLIREHGSKVRDGWQLKSFAMLWSRFAEVLLLDADQVPILDPTACFDWPEYRDKGAVFWPDVVDLLESNPVWSALGLSARRERSMESGQILVDKRVHLRALAIVAQLNEAADLLYQVIYGDKDTFLLGWEIAGAALAMVPHRPFRDDAVLVQRDFVGTPLFQHRTGGKWRYGGEQVEVENFVHGEACAEAMRNLQKLWGGHVFHAPDRTAAARRAEDQLVAAGPLQMDVRGEGTFALVLLPYGEIGDGRALDRRNWWCESSDGTIRLCLARPEGVTYWLERIDSGAWTGRRLRPPETGVDLTLHWSPSAERSLAPGLVEQLLRAARFGRPDADESRLVAALILLARVEPGAVEQLRLLVQRAAPGDAAGLARLLGQIEAEGSGAFVDAERRGDVLSAGYSSYRDHDD